MAGWRGVMPCKPRVASILGLVRRNERSDDARMLIQKIRRSEGKRSHSSPINDPFRGKASSSFETLSLREKLSAPSTRKGRSNEWEEEKLSGPIWPSSFRRTTATRSPS
ncbi:hypothetical protein AXF42_Ash021777 [Apostasia shenzhenica]|uniref:Uncharacterized protein n=1 Tax=Apostasia shenzhenica TaxID=1088818 RepID=A0A2H9ZRV1_9ASPA|nr:hypothetical protein AXF42_Ash021777 [Apostasia shenzhenica]